MAYKRWDKNKIRQQVKYLKSRYKHTKDVRFLIDAQHLETLLTIPSNLFEVFSTPTTFKDGLLEDFKALELYYDFLDDIKEFSANNADKFKDLKPFEVDHIANLTPSLLFSFLKDFFYDFDKEFGEIYESIHKERQHNLMFSEDRSISYYVPALEYSYINITKNDTVDDFLNAVHEYTHAIVDRLYFRLSEEEYPFTELVSIFMEMIAADYIKEAYLGMDEDINTSQLSGAKKITVYAENISIQHNYFLAKEETNTRKEFVQDITKMSGKTNSYIKRLLSKTAMEKLTYTIPYLTAIELYYLYKSDKERCVELIKYLIYVSYRENYNVDLVDNGIILNTHSTEWIDTLIKRKNDYDQIRDEDNKKRR